MNQLINNIEKELAAQLSVKTGAIVHLSGGFQNDVFKVISKKGNYIARLSKAEKRTNEMLQAEVEWLLHLDKNGVSVNVPLTQPNGEYLSPLSANGQDYVLMLFTEAKGSLVNVMNSDEWNANLFYQWGKMIGKMHALSKNADKLMRPMWSKENQDLYGLVGKIDSTEIAIKYDDLLKELGTYEKNENLFGLIHNDLHQGNFFVNEGALTIFDFDDCSYSWYANDLAVSLYHAYWQATSFNGYDENFVEQFMSAMLEGYASEQTVSKELLLQIPIFLKIREVFLYSLFKQKWDVKTMEEWQIEKLSELEENIKNEVVYTGFYPEQFL